MDLFAHLEKNNKPPSRREICLEITFILACILPRVLEVVVCLYCLSDTHWTIDLNRISPYQLSTTSAVRPPGFPCVHALAYWCTRYLGLSCLCWLHSIVFLHRIQLVALSTVATSGLSGVTGCFMEAYWSGSGWCYIRLLPVWEDGTLGSAFTRPAFSSKCVISVIYEEVYSTTTQFWFSSSGTRSLLCYNIKESSICGVKRDWLHNP